MDNGVKTQSIIFNPQLVTHGEVYIDSITQSFTQYEISTWFLSISSL